MVLGVTAPPCRRISSGPIVRRAPITAELTLYSILAFIPLGLLSGVIAGSRRNKAADHGFRFTAYVATSLPPFILALILMAFFYVELYWFAPGRTSSSFGSFINSDNFRQVTGLLTLDGLINGRPDITIDALRHLAMLVFTLAIVHWATLGRVTRATMIDELNQDYVIAARARGIPVVGCLTPLIWIINIIFAIKANKGVNVEIPVITSFAKGQNWM